ncbi:MAG: ornithine cyclodeaminase family protein [Pseudomonadota bacterium]
MSHPDVEFTYLSGADIDALEFSDAEILQAIDDQIIEQGQGRTVIEPRMHLRPKDVDGHFNVLRGAIGEFAGVKVVGDYVHNYKLGLPSEMAFVLLFDPQTGMPRAILDGTAITDMRTGALTALGGKYLARKDSRVLGNIGARGSSYWNVRLLDHLFDFDEIRVHSRRPESRDAFGERLSTDLGKKVTVTDNWQDCLEGADIMVEASRLLQPEPLFKTSWIKKGALVIPYGTMSTVEYDITDIMDKIVMDDWGQASAGPFGCLRRHVDDGKLTEETLHAEIGQIAAGMKPGRETDEETILFWHRGLSLSDIALGAAMLKKAQGLGLGRQLPL